MSFYGVPRDPSNVDAKRLTSRAPSGNQHHEPLSVAADQKQFMILISQALARGVLAPPEGVKDYRGVKRGRMTIVTYSHTVQRPNKDRSHYWVARCLCGEHEIRNHRTLGRKDAEVEYEMCSSCRHAEVLKVRALGLSYSERDARQAAERAKSAERRTQLAAEIPTPAPPAAKTHSKRPGPDWPTMGTLFGS